jgi:glycosyltransferase involved in cell wall biosynthesis
MSKNKKLTIIMPCLNEERTIGSCILEAQSWIKSSGEDVEILISDNGSTDKSVEIAKSLGVRVVVSPEKGYGNALRFGISSANSKYVIFGDSDGSYDFSNLTPFVDKLDQGFDIVMGNRFKGGIQKNAMPFLNKYLGNPGLSWLARTVHKIPIGDFNCGLRAFNLDSYENVKLKTTGMEFASEMVIAGVRKGLSIVEVSTILRKDGRDRKPHLRPWRDGFRNVKVILFTKFNNKN